MNGNFLTVTLFSYFKEPIHVFLVFASDYQRSTQGSSIRIDIFVFRSALNSKKLDETVKILGK